MTRERAEAMVLAGVQSVSVSIDGLEASHGHLRGREGSWQRALLALRLLPEAGSKISVNTQINQRTWQDLPELLERIAIEGVHAWQRDDHGRARHPAVFLSSGAARDGEQRRWCIQSS